MTPEQTEKKRIYRLAYNKKHNEKRAHLAKSPHKLKLTKRRCQAIKGGRRCRNMLPVGYFQRCRTCTLAERKVGEWG